MKSLRHHPRLYVRTVILTGVLMLLSPSWAQAQQNNRHIVQRRPIDRQQLDNIDTQLKAVETKVNQLIQNQGGRFVFLVSGNGEFVRLDTHKGEIAVFSLVKGASWFTLDIPEQTIRPGDAFYEQFVQTIDQLDFNNN